jgi:hypothetical protein
MANFFYRGTIVNARMVAMLRVGVGFAILLGMLTSRSQRTEAAVTKEDLEKMSVRVSADLNSNNLTLPETNSRYIWSEFWRINVDKFFAAYSGDEPVLFYPLWVGTEGFGNSFGYLLEAISCARISRLHFVGFETEYWYGETHKQSNISKLFTKLVPRVIRHENPVPSMGEITRNSCWEGLFPWETKGAFTYQNLDLLQLQVVGFTDRFRAAVLKNKDSFGTNEFDRIINIANNISYAKPLPQILQVKRRLRYEGARMLSSDKFESGNVRFPFVPEVTILFRCVDMLQHGEGSPYGFLPFRVYKEIIPPDVKDIYVLTESLMYSQGLPNIPNQKACVAITEALLMYLSQHYVNATVGLRRGNSGEAFCQLSLSSIMISTPSSFGFYAGLAQSDQHDVYLPETRLLASGENIFIHKHFHWMPFPKIVQFGYYLRDHNNKIDVEAFLKMLLP